MRLKEFFTVPAGQKITEKHLRRVLISSICSILLCMSCLVGTTWAWFVVSIENTGNVIWIGEPQVHLTVDGSGYDAGTKLTSGNHTVFIEHASKADDLDQKSTLYVTLTIEYHAGTLSVYTVLDAGNQYQTSVQIETEKEYTLHWQASWFAPAGAEELTDSTIALTAEEPTEPSEEETTQPSGESVTEEPATEPSAEEATEPSEDDATEAATEPVTEPSTEPPTEPATEPTAEAPTVGVEEETP